MTHWSDSYVGRPYVVNEFDCAELAATVRREVFGDEVSLPTRVAGRERKNLQVEQCLADYGVETMAPEDGDAVLLKYGARWHIGVYCRIGGGAFVLHGLKSAGQVVLHRLTALRALGYRIEGYYRWT